MRLFLLGVGLLVTAPIMAAKIEAEVSYQIYENKKGCQVTIVDDSRYRQIAVRKQTFENFYMAQVVLPKPDQGEPEIAGYCESPRFKAKVRYVSSREDVRGRGYTEVICQEEPGVRAEYDLGHQVWSKNFFRFQDSDDNSLGRFNNTFNCENLRLIKSYATK